jgi:predicted metal-binding membrane protein
VSSSDPAVARSHAPAGAVGVVAAIAGTVLVAWQLSPEAALLGHGSGTAGPAGPPILLWFTLSWLLMAAATMLPTSIPLLTAFGQVVGLRSDAHRLIITVVAAYLAVWAAAGLGLASVDAAVHTVADRTPLGGHAPLILAATLAVASAYQLSARSDRCLRSCRSPFSFIATRWTGTRTPSSQATLIGIDYGVSCLSCCAAVMLVMFAVGMTSPLVMVALGGVSAAHKLAPWGPALARLTGWTLLAVAAGAATLHLVRIG